MSAIRPTALIIEDDADLRQLYGVVLQRAGYTVDYSGNGRHARALLHDSSPDLIITDLHLPGMYGPDLVRWIRQQPHLATCTVMVISGNGRAAAELHDEVDFVFNKPVSMVLVAKLATKLQNRATSKPHTQNFSHLADLGKPFSFRTAQRQGTW